MGGGNTVGRKCCHYSATLNESNTSDDNSDNSGSGKKCDNPGRACRVQAEVVKECENISTLDTSAGSECVE